MGLDGELTGILRDVVQFLECLREAKLPVTLESIRDNLLIRSKDTLATFTVEKIGRPTSPEPYLNMNAGSKGLLSRVEAEVQEYVGAEEPRLQKHQDYYESFQEPVPLTDYRANRDREIERTLLDIYASLSAAQTRSTCQKCGPLYRKEGKKLFVFEQYRACWVGLLGSHLLIYGNDRDSRPCMVQPIRGYMARPAPNVIPRDQRRSESAFEIFRPGSRTLQFIARTPKEMEQWVAKICQVSSDYRDEGKSTSEPINALVEADAPRTEAREDSKCSEERYQDVGSLLDKTVEETLIASRGTSPTERAESSSSKDIPLETANPPPLPARTPRKLPSLPHTDTVSSYEPQEDEEDDIYHKIEDFRDSMHYQNLVESAKPGTYDDVRATKEKTKKRMKTNEKRKDKSIEKVQRKSTEIETTYDDISSTMTKDKIADDQDKPVSYDDVESLVPMLKSTEDATKSPQKRSFLDRVRSRKESPRKLEKKTKRKTPTPPPANIEELPTYDDVSDLVNSQENKSFEEELPEYNCPPPPRPVYAKPPTIPNPTVNQEFYDDVGACREKYNEEDNKIKLEQVPMNLQRIPGKSNVHTACTSSEESTVSENIQQQSLEESEHYQTPRNELCHRSQALLEKQEELYDDIAILADFTARQKGSIGRKDGEDSRGQASPEKKSWNRFVSSRKSRSNESAETNIRVFNGVEDADELSEHHSLIRMNTFQKLISKMENSLGKASSKM